MAVTISKIQPLSSPPPFQNPNHDNTHSIRFSHSLSPLLLNISPNISNPRRHHHQHRQIKTFCITPVDEIALPYEETDPIQLHVEEEDGDDDIITGAFEKEVFSGNEEDIWKQMKEIILFAGPAVGLWICGPLMSLIDTAVIGQGSSLELAALGPGTVVCDYASYVFMFLSIATSNMVATSLAHEGHEEVQHKLSMLLFVGLTCGMGMLLLTKVFGAQILVAFTGTKNLHIVPAANTYVQIRGLAWPAILVGWVAQSASLGMKDSWGPLKALAVASAVNAIGDIVLCCYMGYGIAGAAWATMVSQAVAAFMMIESLNKKGFNAYSVSIPSPKELQKIFELAAPVFIMMVSKVAFYSLLTYFATSMGTITIAAHQVMIQVYCMCTVWGEPLSQTAQSFMPELIFGVNRSLKKARMLLKSLVIIGAITGSVLGIIGTTVPWVFPKLFTADIAVIGEMHKVLLSYFIALMVTPATHSLEGTLLAGQDLRFLSFSMSGCFTLGGLLVMEMDKQVRSGLRGFWKIMEDLKGKDDTKDVLDSALKILDDTPFGRVIQIVGTSKMDTKDVRRAPEDVNRMVRFWSSSDKGFKIAGRVFRMTAIDVKNMFGFSCTGLTPRLVDIKGERPKNNAFFDKYFPDVKRITKKTLTDALDVAVAARRDEDIAVLLLMILLCTFFFATTSSSMSFTLMTISTDLKGLKKYAWAVLVLSTLESALDKGRDQVSGYLPVILYWVADRTKLIGMRKEGKSDPLTFCHWNLWDFHLAFQALSDEELDSKLEPKEEKMMASFNEGLKKPWYAIEESEEEPSSPSFNIWRFICREEMQSREEEARRNMIEIISSLEEKTTQQSPSKEDKENGEDANESELEAKLLQKLIEADEAMQAQNKAWWNMIDNIEKNKDEYDKRIRVLKSKVQGKWKIYKELENDRNKYMMLVGKKEAENDDLRRENYELKKRWEGKDIMSSQVPFTLAEEEPANVAFDKVEKDSHDTDDFEVSPPKGLKEKLSKAGTRAKPKEQCLQSMKKKINPSDDTPATKVAKPVQKKTPSPERVEPINLSDNTPSMKVAETVEKKTPSPKRVEPVQTSRKLRLNRKLLLREGTSLMKQNDAVETPLNDTIVNDNNGLDDSSDQVLTFAQNEPMTPNVVSTQTPEEVKRGSRNKNSSEENTTMAEIVADLEASLLASLDRAVLAKRKMKESGSLVYLG